MPIVRDFAIDFDPLTTLQRLGRDPVGAFGARTSPESYSRALDEARPLIHPAYCYDVYPVLGTQSNALRIAQGQLLESPVVASLFAGAPEVALLVYTIGQELEARVKELQRAGALSSSLFLDRMGTLALQEVGRVGYESLEELARSKSVRASLPLNPGTTHWPASGQLVFQELCPLQEIGVSVTDSFLLLPYKSISMVVALGTDVLTPAEGSSCDYCETRHLCHTASG